MVVKLIRRSEEMAKEIKTINVAPANEERTIRSFLAFGWTLRGNQEVYNKDSHNETWGNTRYSVTETTHYVKLTFERDPALIKNFQQICQLENAFYAIPEPKKKPRKEWKSVFATLYVIFGLLALLFLMTPAREGAMIFVVAIALLAYLHYRYNAKIKAWQDAYNKCWSKREQIIAKAEPYLD